MKTIKKFLNDLRIKHMCIKLYKYQKIENGY